MASPWPFTVQGCMAWATGAQGLAAIRDHPLAPQGFVCAAWRVQVRKPADVMHCTWPLHTAECPRLRQEPLHDFPASSVDLLWVIVEGALPVSAEDDPATPGTQRGGACSAFVVHLQHLPWAMRRGDRGPLCAKDGMDARPMFMRERLGERPLHHPVDMPQPMHMQGHLMWFTDIPHGGRAFGAFFIGKTTYSACPGVAADAGVRRSD
jgi:hypothetical protein